MLKTWWICVCVTIVTFISIRNTGCLAHDEQSSSGLPHTHYQPKEGDPEWFKFAVQMHGHLGPWVVTGVRFGMAGAKAVEAKDHFDVEVVCEGPFEKPPRSCFIDGVQLGSGATLGKRAIRVLEAKEIVLVVRNTETGKTVEVRPTQKLLDILQSKQKGARRAADYEQTARDIAAMPDGDILSITPRPVPDKPKQ